MVTVTQTVTTMLTTLSATPQAGPGVECRRDLAGRCISGLVLSPAAAPPDLAYIPPLRVTLNAASQALTTLVAFHSTNATSTTMAPSGMP